jgi:7-keto-8-aminopelargonate synthetase-like enzyme
MRLTQRWATKLEELRRQGRYRELALPQGADLTSNDYLGYAGIRSPSAGCDLPRSGTGSRLLRGHYPVWDDVEAELARWHGAEAALIMTSGYAANEGLLATVIEPDDWAASDEFNHASIIDGLRLAGAERFIYRHQDLNQLESGLRRAAAKRTARCELFIVTESLFGMDGDVTPLGPLVELAERHGAHVIVDEAHSTGCFGPGGSGLVDAAGLRGRVLATVHTGGKALGVTGAYVVGSALLRELLVNRCRHFIFTTALPPALGAWWCEALARVQGDDAARVRLHQAAGLFRAELARHRISAPGSHYIVPIVLGCDRAAVEAAARLRAAGWDIRAVRFPSVPAGSARLRVSVHADHGPEMLVAAAAAIARAVADVGGQP